MEQEPRTPELDKLRKVQATSQAIGEFLDWLFSQKMLVLGRWPRPDECTNCGCDKARQDVEYVEFTEYADALVSGLGLSPKVEAQLRDRLVKEGDRGAVRRYATRGCSECGASVCAGYFRDEEHLIPERPRIVTLLAEYFHIDEKKAEDERRALLEYVRTLNPPLTKPNTAHKKE